MKKVFILLTIIFLVILIFLIIALNLISGKKGTESVSTITPIPTIYYGGIYSRPKTSMTPTQNNLQPSIIQTTTPINEKNKINFKEISNKVYILSRSDINELQTIKKNLPYENEDFSVDYSPVLDLFIIQKKTQKADEEIKTWADANGISKLIGRKDIFQITDKPVQEYKQEIEQKYQQNQNASVESQSKSTNNSSTNSTTTSQNNTLKQLIDIFKDVFNSETLKKFSISITPTPSIKPTGQPNPTGSSNNSVPASLTELFNEIGSKVGVPPKIIEGTMKIESPSSFNFSSDEIAEYSKPGSIIPGCGPNLCSATGPMQMTIGIDDQGDTSCPRCGAGYCPNAWAGYGSSVNYYGLYTHNPNPCNLRDNVYAAADKLKKDSGATDPSNWTQEQVYRAAERYYGRCDDNHRYPRLDNKTYCEYLWWYYKNSSSNSNTTSKSGFTYYCQGNTEWKNNCSLGRAGCAPSSLAMIISSFGIQMTPVEVDAVFQQNGWRTCGDNASYLTTALNSSWFANLGFTVGPDLAYNGVLNIEESKKYIDNGFLLIASSKAYPCASCSSQQLIDHAFAVDNVDPASKTVSIRDPNNCSYNDGNDENESKRIKNASDFPWLYTYPIKKI